LIYSSYRARGREYQQTPHIDRKKRHRSKDYEPQKRITLVLQKPVPCFSKILSRGHSILKYLAINAVAATAGFVIIYGLTFLLPALARRYWRWLNT
jgi:hypothetical protein